MFVKNNNIWFNKYKNNIKIFFFADNNIRKK